MKIVKTLFKTETFNLENGFFFDITDTGEEYRAFLYNENCGVKQYIYSATKEAMGYDDFLETIKKSINQDILEYMTDYMAEGEDDV